MNGIEKISARILADAEAEAAAIRGQAEEKAAQIAADYDKKIAAEQQRLSAEVEAEAAKQLERDQGAARMAARRQLLETKQALVDKAFRQAEQQLRSLPQAEYEALCAHLACGASTSGCEELIFSAEDRERVGAAVTAKANELLQKASDRADEIISEANDKKLAEEREYDRVRLEVTRFKSDVLNLYRTHVESLSRLPEFQQKEETPVQDAEAELPETEDADTTEEAAPAADAAETEDAAPEKAGEDFWEKDESQLKLDPPPADPNAAFQGVNFSE